MAKVLQTEEKMFWLSYSARLNVVRLLTAR
jgi:hypothetical protein